MGVGERGILGFVMEFDPKFADVIIKRWQDFTGKQAVLESTGKTYTDMEKDRG